MKTALAQLDFHVGNFEHNIAKIIDAVEKAKENYVQLIIFPELAVSGYPPRDFLTYKNFITKCNEALNEIAKHCFNITAIVGSPEINFENKGKTLFNSAFVLHNGKINTSVRKTLLPDYDIFDEYRYFEPNREFKIIEIGKYKFALTICEDLWNLQEQALYIRNPMDELAKQKPDFIINIAASPFNYNQAEIRKNILINNVKKYGIPLIYVNQTGAQTELIFDGGSLVLNNQGYEVINMPFFEESIKYIDINNINTLPTINSNTFSEISLIHDALVLGIKDYFLKMGFKKAILGLSGGLDSAVCLVLAIKALGNENVRAVLMPSQYSSEHSIADAKELAENLNCEWNLVPINDTFNSINNSLKPFFKDLPFNTTEENIQARIRAVILMAFSNKFGYILLNTSNKSEAAVGYGTLYGDMCGGISVLGDVYKTKVYELADYINADKVIIPINTINKPPSAELRPNQKDSDSLPNYNLLDKVLYYYIEEGKNIDEIVKLGYDKTTVSKIIHLVNCNEYKRYQSPPVLRVTSKAFGMGRRMPLEGKYNF
jgi:NAD+ synthase (glutamine-hydrolysing)